MLWALAAYITHVIEMAIHSHAVQGMSPLAVMPFFYLCVALFMGAYNITNSKRKTPINFAEMLQHKGILLLYFGGGLIGNIFWFSSLSFIGIGTVTFILVLIRIFVTAYSYFFMDDRFSADRAAAIIISFAAVLAFSFGAEEVNLPGVFLALASCFAFTAETIAKKKLSHTPIPPENIVMVRAVILGVVSFMIFLILLPFNIPFGQEYGTLTNVSNLLFIALAAFVGGILAKIFTFFALREISLSYYEALNASKPVAMALIGVFFFGEVITAFQAVMGAVIIMSSLYFLWPNKKQKKS